MEFLTALTECDFYSCVKLVNYIRKEVRKTVGRRVKYTSPSCSLHLPHPSSPFPSPRTPGMKTLTSTQYWNGTLFSRWTGRQRQRIACRAPLQLTALLVEKMMQTLLQKGSYILRAGYFMDIGYRVYTVYGYSSAPYV